MPCLDLKKAFDTVDDNILLATLNNFNFSEHTIKWMKSYLTDNSVKLPYLRCQVGSHKVPYSDLFYFTYYINDLPNVCGNIHIQMYADDDVIFTPEKNMQEPACILTSAMTQIHG